ncbi:nSTAND1 domain-containing NTPase, partial [Nostoc sp.]|uniref:nSTAND1 domain-containing NTPase n=1 Tax=Nostoc sp. TaxID=1180 RepID=UPI003B60297C
MNEPIYPEEDIILQNERSLSTLIRAIAHSQNRFSLILVRCNYTYLREQILEELRQRSKLQISEIIPDKSETNFYATITTTVTDNLSATSVPKALIVSGLECVTALDDLLISMNRVRNDFLSFSFPFVFWINDAVLQKFIKLAPDFYSYAGVPIKFAPVTNELVDFLQDEADSLFTKILEAGADQFLDNAIFNLEMGAGKRFEIESALQELDSRNCSEPKLKANQQFILGRDAYVNNNMERSRQLYDESLAFWQQGNNSIRSSADIERYACLLFHLGLWWRRYAVLHRAEYKTACRQAQNYYQQCIEILELANRFDLAAKFINSWAEVLQQLEEWDKLETVAKRAIKLHRKYPNDIRLANAYAFLAEFALGKCNWSDAKHHAQTALTIIAQRSMLPSSPNNRWVQQYYQSWYRLLIAKAQQSEGDLQEALQNLETAKEGCKADYHPQRYVRILDALWELYYYEQHCYLKAFELKQEKHSIEQQYGFRAFIGAGQLQSQRQVLNPILGAFYNGAVTVKTQQGRIAQEIIASGREQDVSNLIKRISRDDQKLIIIYGPSGVGKSSLLTAGLVPTLEDIPAVNSRNHLPVVVRFDSDWIRELGKALLLAIRLKLSLVEPQELSSPEEILQQLRRNADYNLLTILIFDQFEEFFFNYFQPAQRKEFWQFLKACLDSIYIPYVKVIFSLREDYLSNFLKCERIVDLEVTNNDIFTKNIRYYVDNFSPDTAKKVIESLTQRSSYLEPSLIDELVRNLAEEQGDVRPIELQIVGVQLETDKITTLERYQQIGSKKQLIQRFLEQVVEDCGQENEQRVANLVLYFLTDENDTRPLKTRAELQAKLVEVLPTQVDKLELVLEILVKSGIVFLKPQFSTDYYQLVHDYLVSFIRQQRGAELYTELKTEKEKRQQAETQRLIAEAEAQRLIAEAEAQRLIAEAETQRLKAQAQAQRLKAQVQAQRLKAQRSKIAYWAVIGLVVLIAVVVVGVKSKIGEINAQLSAYASSSARLVVANLHEEALIESIKEGEQLQQPIWANWVEADTKTLVNTALRQAVYESFGKENKTLTGHTARVRSVSFSPDGKMMASASDDNTVKLWNRYSGKQINTLTGHTARVRSVSFSPDGKMMASASDDNTVKLW